MKMPSLVMVLMIAAGFIVLSGQSLPPIVASHFAAGGNANGFMPRSAYVGLMLFIAVGVPFFLALLHSSLRFIPPHRINLPNRDYWLSPERAEETFAFLYKHGIFLSVLLTAFLSFVHWLVVRANQLQPPYFSTSLLIKGLAVLALAITVWIGVLIVHFSRGP